MSQKKEKEKNSVEHSRRDVEEFFEFKKLDSRAALLFEADVDDAWRRLGVQGDTLDDVQFKGVVRTLSDNGWYQRHPVGRFASAEQMRYSVDVDTDIMDTETVAKFFNVSPRTIQGWVSKNYIPNFHIGNFVRFRLTDINSWIDGLMTKGRRTLRPTLREAA
ncbi:MAG: hypothetical protein A3G34_07945 [Candidatus Lindowbacteria bacterium RIFCSPLOWO2_12_FULL_62_27]|nr:MAG: hypothetical protein A3G34_07945 [Candidatus Lindowbacteria bacterium RIFCSPLOWO2_12_FULL_62_27]